MKRTILIILTPLLLLNNCFTGWEGEGTITINIDSGNSRAAMPWPDADESLYRHLEHKIIMTGNGSPIEFTAPAGSAAVRRSVPAGKYTVTVAASLKGKVTPLSPDGGEIPYATGTSAADVKAGRNNQVNITMSGVRFCKECDFIYEKDAGFIAEGLMIQTCNGDSSHNKSHILEQKKIMNYDDWNEAFEIVSGGINTLIIGADIKLPPQTFQLDSKLTLIGAASAGSTAVMRTISLSQNGSLFSLSNGASITLDSNITLNGLTKGRNGATQDNDAPLVRVQNGGTFAIKGNSSVTGNTNAYGSGGGVYVAGGAFTMSGNSSLTGNTANDEGGGVYVAGNNASFTMSGGVISRNASHSDSGSGGGGGVHVGSGGSFNMSDGTISNNNAYNGNPGDGGGVFITGGGNFTMSGGAISSNTAYNGGGVLIVDGGFTMQGDARVSGNTAGGFGSGGGVYVSGWSSFAMNENASVSGNSAATFGGGVYVENFGEFDLNGGTVTGSGAYKGMPANKAPSGGAALYVYPGGTAKYGAAGVFPDGATNNAITETGVQ
ncbi:MAG: hypothetical protein LBH44_05310 [Treponema sp.]|jgi:hypothetical protein|nr:hypothetical protein [Treponema sp.]